ncbi:hypothetical protein KCU92_g113, partial [Aureobasidium melanogenum]
MVVNPLAAERLVVLPDEIVTGSWEKMQWIMLHLSPSGHVTGEQIIYSIQLNKREGAGAECSFPSSGAARQVVVALLPSRPDIWQEYLNDALHSSGSEAIDLVVLPRIDLARHCKRRERPRRTLTSAESDVIINRREGTIKAPKLFLLLAAPCICLSSLSKIMGAQLS